jgi:hypothetical protein
VIFILIAKCEQTAEALHLTFHAITSEEYFVAVTDKRQKYKV